MITQSLLHCFPQFPLILERSWKCLNLKVANSRPLKVLDKSSNLVQSLKISEVLGYFLPWSDNIIDLFFKSGRSKNFTYLLQVWVEKFVNIRKYLSWNVLEQSWKGSWKSLNFKLLEVGEPWFPYCVIRHIINEFFFNFSNPFSYERDWSVAFMIYFLQFF